MIPDVSKALNWLDKHYSILQGIQRGIERETLRITPNGQLAQTPFPREIGAALTHPWITTDFAESMLEFITPVNTNIDYMLNFLKDLHRYANVNIGDELLWPLSMPCFIAKEQDITIAQYGSSNEGLYKTVYREGLKNRYGAMMQIISGVHYNFSLPIAFWQARDGVKNTEEGKSIISEGYFRLIRNYYRFGWVIPYLFGASPSMCPSFIQDKQKAKDFIELTQGKDYLPYATSLRLSDVGYTNQAQKQLGITFNHLENYVVDLKRASHTKSAEFSQIGFKKDGYYRQLNDNILQIENEFYAPIRPKRVTSQDELPSDALLRGGIEYIEVRALDVNPFSPVGITEDQIRFIDLFLIWCSLAPAPEMNSQELECAKQNWNKIIIEGRKPGLELNLGCQSNTQSLPKIAHALFKDLLRVADVLDHQDDKKQYRNVCEKHEVMFDHPELTLSARTLQAISDLGTAEFGLTLSKQYKKQLISEPFTLLTDADFLQQRDLSVEKQIKKQASDILSFDEYLRLKNKQ